MASQAAIITTPTGLVAGDQYRLVFVTSTTTAATSSDIAFYNAFVTAAAALNTDLDTFSGTVEGTTTWTAIASTATDNALANTGTTPGTDGTGVPIYLLNDTVFASNYTALWDSNIQNPLQINESGNSSGNISVWTGSTSSGTEDVDSLGDSIVNYGANRFYNDVSQSSYWISRNFSAANTTENSMYAISGVLTVVPEPSSFALLGGLLALGHVMVRRRR